MNTRQTTIHSEYHQLRAVLLCQAETAFGSADKLSRQWKSLNYVTCPGYEKALREYQQFADIFMSQNIQCHYLPQNRDMSLDALYCRDASIATDFGYIICNMGKAARDMEPAAHAAYYKQTGQNILGIIEPPGTLEGGDVAWIDRRTLAVGHSYRTNYEGIRQLRAMVSAHGIELLEADLPHYKGPQDVFHLMSVFSPVDKNLAVVYSPLLPIGFRKELIRRGYEFIEVSDDEFESMGCNVLAVAARKCILVAGNPKTEAALAHKGCKVWAYKGNEISVKGGGGPTCLTRPMIRVL
ncbi:MAG: arginine deiminase family protein [Flavobacteriaceae bacterium]